jgi:riboflavin-specific deaminase-like protein
MRAPSVLAGVASAPLGPEASALDRTWRIALAVAAARRRGPQPASGDETGLRRVPGSDGIDGLEPISASDPAAALHPDAQGRWTLAPDAPRDAHDLWDLYRPLLELAPGDRYVVGHLGTSIDGRIATGNGDSRYVNGQEDLIHLHRMRALSDAVVVGVTTATADDPLLTTRLATGPNPLRVVIDPMARTPSTLRLFEPGGPPTLLACAPEHHRAAALRLGDDRVVAVASRNDRLDLACLLDALAERGARLVFVEGGGITVSRFLEEDRLDRLQVAVAPVIVGEGRVGLRLPGAALLRDCARPARRLFRLGDDVLWDYDLRGRDAVPQDAARRTGPVRIG